MVVDSNIIHFTSLYKPEKFLTLRVFFIPLKVKVKVHLYGATASATKSIFFLRQAIGCMAMNGSAQMDTCLSKLCCNLYLNGKSIFRRCRLRTVWMDLYENIFNGMELCSFSEALTINYIDQMSNFLPWCLLKFPRLPISNFHYLEDPWLDVRYACVWGWRWGFRMHFGFHRLIFSTFI